jgi:hypothetical protein
VNRVDRMHATEVDELQQEAPIRVTTKLQGPRLAPGVGPFRSTPSRRVP